MAPAGSPSIYVLPLEIIEDAIDIIAADDRQTSPFTLPNVKACSLTCHTFLPRSRRHIFRSIMIRDAHPYIQRFPPAAPSPLASSFAALLAASPHIAELVRELHYIFPEIGGRLSNASPILQKLTKLEMFGLYPDDGGTVSWWGLNPQSRSIFISLMHLPSMIHLRLGSVTDFPLSLLFSCVNLQTLCLDGVKFDEHNVHMTTQPSSSRNIKLLELELKIDHFINNAVFEIAKMITKNGDPIFDLSGLKKLTTTIHSREQLELTYKTLRRATNIESIHLLARPSHSLGPDHPTALERVVSALSPSLKTLKYLHLDLYVDTPKQAPLAEMPRALKLIATEAKHVRYLKIRINVSKDTEYVYDVPQNGDECPWSLLEQALIAPGYWPSLKVVDLGIIVKGSGRMRDSDGDWERRFSEFYRFRISSLSRRAAGLEIIPSLSVE